MKKNQSTHICCSFNMWKQYINKNIKPQHYEINISLGGVTKHTEVAKRVKKYVKPRVQYAQNPCEYLRVKVHKLP